MKTFQRAAAKTPPTHAPEGYDQDKFGKIRRNTNGIVLDEIRLLFGHFQPSHTFTVAEILKILGLNSKLCLIGM